MKYGLLSGVLLVALVVMPPGSAAADQWRERTESLTVDHENIEFISFQNIDFTRFEYQGIEDTDRIDISIAYRVDADTDEIAEEMFSEFNLDIDSLGGRVQVNFEHPKQHEGNFLRRMFGRNRGKWEATMRVTGPRTAHMDIDAEFSTLMMEYLERGVSLTTGFTESELRDIVGRLEGKCEFGQLTVSGLAGEFEIVSEFGGVEMEVVGLDGDSSLSVEFGEASLDLPAGRGMTFSTDTSFGDIDFDIDEPVTLDDSDGRRMTLSGGGPAVRLKANFGSIKVSDAASPRDRQTGARTDRAGRTDRRRAATPEPEPPFVVGTVQSITIRGNALLGYSDLEDDLGIEAGRQYTRNQLDEAVDSLPSRNRFVESAWYRIDTDGRMTIWVDEDELYDLDGEPLISFDRAAGFGLGADFILSSIVGPFSELGARGAYNWGTKDWTYRISAEKRVFTHNQLAFGGSYRNAYESSLDWAIPSHDRSANSFLLGLEIDNVYQVKGSTVFVSQSLGDWFTVMATYFDEEYSSLAKNTNWSLFNHDHVKAPNALLTPASEGTVTGMRYTAELSGGNSISHTALVLEAEQTLDANTTLDAYTRYLGTLSYRQMLQAHQAVIIRLAGGYSNDPLPDQKAFRLGGLNTLRGFAPGMVPEPPAGMDGFDYHGGGNRMVLANVEYMFGRFRRGLFDDVGIVFFADAGGVWRDGEDFSADGLKRDVGIGLSLDGFIEPLEIIDPVESSDRLRVNWAVPVGHESHKSRWTVNFSRPF